MVRKTAGFQQLIKQGKKARMPEKISPMLCTLTREPVTEEGYLHEIKFDGYRIISYKQKKKIKFHSRSGLDYTSKYPSLVKAMEKLNHDCIIDGEICALDNEGRPSFDTLQKPSADTHLVYYVFDIIWLDGYLLTELELQERKKILRIVVANNPLIRYSEEFENGPALFKQMQEQGMEGIVSKKATSFYKPGERSRSWYKTPTEMRQEYVIGGWVESDRGRPFASLLFGAYKGKELHWVGHAGGGFKEKEMPAILRKLRSLEIKKSPFKNKVEASGIAHWVKPQLVANFKFATFTKSGRIRKPAIFLGFRDDKKPGQVVQEVPVEEKNGKQQTKLLPTMPDSNWPKIESQEPELSEEIRLGKCRLNLTDPGRMIWKDISKAALLEYYHHCSKFILPFLKDRPQSLHIKPVNAGAPGFYIKDMEGREPDCATIFTDKRKHKAEGKRKVIDYLVCNNEATLLYMINLGCVDINPWNSRVQSPNHPDYIIIDLDPSDDDFSRTIDPANALKELLKKKKLPSFVKTSGKTGLHILIPSKGIDHAKARAIASSLCNELNELLPDQTTTEISVEHRKGKVYLDINQNDYADTIAAPFSVRPFHKPTVSTPLEWKEVKRGLEAERFTMDVIGKEMSRRFKIWENLM